LRHGVHSFFLPHDAYMYVWPGCVMVRSSDLRRRGRVFNFRPFKLEFHDTDSTPLARHVYSSLRLICVINSRGSSLGSRCRCRRRGMRALPLSGNDLGKFNGAFTHTHTHTHTLRWDEMGSTGNSMQFNGCVYTLSYQHSPSHPIPSLAMWFSRYASQKTDIQPYSFQYSAPFWSIVKTQIKCDTLRSITISNFHHYSY